MMGWWDFAVRAFTALTAPRADVDACDRAVERLARESRTGAAVHYVSVVIQRSWASSLVRGAASSLVTQLMPSSSAWAWRVAGWMAAVTGATALGLNALAPIPAGPLTWVMPTALVGGGLFAMAAAGPLSRAAADRRLRHKVS